MNASLDTNVKRTAKLLIVRAAHPSTTPQEAIGALNLLHQKLSAQGTSIESLLLSDGETASPPAAVDFLQKITALETTLKERNATIATLQRELKEERSKKKDEAPAAAAKSKPQATDIDASDCSYDAFQSAAIRKFKKVHGWQTIFCHHSGVKRATIQQWRQKGKVSEDAYSLLDGITAAESPTKKTAWTDSELSRCIALCKAGDKTDEQIANVLTKEFGRRITPNSIAGTKNRLRLQGKL
jgi:hypothetical protein